jgi:hypothetical protein
MTDQIIADFIKAQDKEELVQTETEILRLQTSQKISPVTTHVLTLLKNHIYDQLGNNKKGVYTPRKKTKRRK